MGSGIWSDLLYAKYRLRIMLAYSSYLPEKSDITNNAFMTVLINCGFSILAGIMIFSVLGYMAQEQGKPLTEWYLQALAWLLLLYLRQLTYYLPHIFLVHCSSLHWWLLV